MKQDVKQKFSSNIFRKLSLLLLFIGSIAFSGCAGEKIQTIRVDSSSGTNTGGISDPINLPTGGSGGNDNGGGDNSGGSCNVGDTITEHTTLTPDSVSGVNVGFLIDDSGSMDNEIAKVVTQIQGFIDAIQQATNDNYKIVLMFDTNGAAIRYGFGGNNPFDPQLADPNVSYIKEKTWSKWSDMAFYRAFAPSDFSQPTPLDGWPLDDPHFGSVYTKADCKKAGDYFRPRQNTANFNNTPACITDKDSLNISDYFLPNVDVNLVELSDDDLNANFDINNFDFNDPSKNAYPEVVDDMIKSMIKPLGSNVSYIYDSIVGDTAGNGVDRAGLTHLALTKLTDGIFEDIRQSDYGPVFDHLQQAVIYSEQKVDLQCTPVPQVDVYFNDTRIDPSLYEVLSDQNKIQILPGAFDGYPSGVSINVGVVYIAS